MFSTVKGRGSTVESRKKAGRSSIYSLRFGRPQSPAPDSTELVAGRRQPPRRGVLLLVVLSMLVLFMLVGTAFLMTSSQSDKASKGSAKLNARGNYGTKLLDRALMEVLRDTDNVNSVVRYHSLLRDVYGTDGFQGVVYKPGVVDFTLADGSGQATRFAGATSAQLLGPTQGQFIDIYVRSLAWDPVNNASLDDPNTTAVNEGSGAGKLFFPDLRHLLKLERNVYGQAQLQTMPLTKGYYNGCLLTITTGSASGQSARILDYEYLGDIPPTQAAQSNTNLGYVPTRLFRFRVMAFQRADGQPLQVDTSAARSPEIGDLAGATFIVNGRAYGGTGAGYNQLASTGQPKLSALELFPTDASQTEFLGAEVALLPNSTYFNPLNQSIKIGAASGVPNPFFAPMPVASLALLNSPTATPSIFFNYPTFVGPGGANETYDAADFQNMFLALQTVTPRAQGRVVRTDGTFSAVDPALSPPDPAKFLRLDLEDVPLPSFHRPDLINFWYHRLLATLTNPSGPFAMAPDQAAQAILNPTATGVNPQAAALVLAIKRQASLRPLHEDHPNFDGSNPLSVMQGLPASGLVDANSQSNIAVPYWEAVGPWDVDNDNDGIPDSIWVDLGDAVQEAEDGTRYKPLYAFLIIDLDSRLNVNAHGLAGDVVPPTLDNTRNAFFDPTYNTNPANWLGNLAHIPGAPWFSTLQLARGSGYGPAEISLRSVFRAPLDASLNPTYGNRDENTGPVDSLATLAAGRVRQNGTTIDGKFGFNPNTTSPILGDAATAGANYRFTSPVPPATPATSPMWYTGETATPDLSAQLKFFDYPWSLNQRSGWGSPPDLKGRYSTGLDYIGQPVYEVVNDVNPNTAASATKLYFNLLAKSPYELDLSRAQRRDAWAVGVNSNIADTATAFNTSLAQNDDAPFSTTDLEKVLRAWDPESGTLPSRLWDVVNDFDPLKLMTYDPNRVVATALAAFGSAGQPEVLTSAQQMAGVSRRLVTTDSFSMPVVGKQMPSYIPELGADGAPGAIGFDDDPDGTGPLVVNGVVDDAAEIGAPGSDDFQSLTGTKYSEGTLVDVLRYRVQRDRISRGYAPYDLAQPVQKSAFDNFTSQVVQQCMSADLMSGLQMDLNRPFGDGRDNPNPLTGAYDGVVDDPLEAGEPFLDINGNGKRDDGTVAPLEPFINLDGSMDANNKPSYTPPSDKLWQQLSPAAFGGNGTLAESIEFDYTNGVAVPVHTSVVASVGQIAGGVRNLESQGRQLYARQLYCLMLMLVDENYIAPWDESDPQVMTWMENEKKKLTSAPLSLPAPQADLIVKRKNTCRMIAQWAINCVDVRDADVINTPFEYDENPWDGWGVWDDNMTPTSTNTPTFIPLDGDPVTDENNADIIDWTNIPNIGGPKALKQLLVSPNPPSGPTPIVTNPLNQTRGVVWGAERPELLITETSGLHDRRTEDLESQDTNGHDKVNGSSTSRYKDIDLDQSLRPRGSAFVELYNPWSSTGQYPAELYSRLDSTTSYAPFVDPINQGVDLARLSNYAVDANGNLTLSPTNAANGVKRSPVWRMIVVEEWPDVRNAEFAGDLNNYLKFHKAVTVANKQSAAYKKAGDDLRTWYNTFLNNPAGNAAPPPLVRWSDPDFSAAFDAAFVPKQVGANNQFTVQYPYIEREFYFTTDKSPVVKATMTTDTDWNYATNEFKLRIPDRSIQIGGIASTAPRAQTQKFISLELETASPNQPAIAPILPGRYAVVGSSGAKYDPTKQTYTTTIGRRDVGADNTTDTQHVPDHTRRIEMRPSNDPTVQQLMVAANGGDPKDEITMGGTYDPYAKEIGRDNELINDNGTIKNVQDSKPADGTTTGNPNNRYYQPCVAIPVDGMSFSEPPWGYGPREKEASAEEAAIKAKFFPTAPKSTQTLAFRKTDKNKYEGRYLTTGGNPSSFDKEFDDLAHGIELTGNRTTANYRTVHLQRLANPLLPWNPEPKLADGKTPNPEYKANLPINPYLTVDSSSVNLTAFNGVSRVESDLDPGKQQNESKFRPWIYGQNSANEVQGYLNLMKTNKQVLFVRTLERGATARLNQYGSLATPVTVLPQRVLFAQEPPSPILIKKDATSGVPEVLDLVSARQMTMRYDEVPGQVVTDQKLDKNLFNMVFEHSLGFGNESFGLLYDAQGSQGVSSAAPVASANGAPAAGRFIFRHDVNATGAVTGTPLTVTSTNPWLEWANRPFVSAEELLKVPAGSQSTMLAMFSIINKTTAVNPYDGTGIANQAAPILPANLKDTVKAGSRWAEFTSPFGHLANLFGSAPWPAGVTRDNTGAPTVDTKGNVQPYGAPNFYRILDFVQVPSRYVGTDTMLNAETFNDVPSNVSATEPVGVDISGPTDPRYNFQPPFNKVSRERDPGRVNLNTVTGRRIAGGATTPNQIWSDVFDGIMHREHDQNPSANQLGHFGPAWRDVVLSRRGYAQFDAAGSSVEKAPTSNSPDTFQFGLNKNFPTFFANPFRSSEAADLVPIPQMMQYGVDATLQRKHPYDRGADGKWGGATPLYGDARDAGFGADDFVSVRPASGSVPSDNFNAPTAAVRDSLPLFGEARGEAFADTNRNPSMMYDPMTRVRNLVTDRSGVFGIWITVGYFEVEPAPKVDFTLGDWGNPTVHARFGGDPNLYNRTYPDGYMLGRELGSDTGDVKRPRGFYIIDRTEEVGFKPGEDLNVEKTIRLRRRIE